MTDLVELIWEAYEWLSATDVETRYGKSKQYWDKLMRTGKLQYQQTSAGKITSDVWVEEFLGNENYLAEKIRRSKPQDKISEEK